MALLTFVGDGFVMPDERMERRFVDALKKPMYADALKLKRDECAAWKPSSASDVKLFFMAVVEVVRIRPGPDYGAGPFLPKKKTHRVLVPVPLSIEVDSKCFQIFNKFEVLCGMPMPIDARIRFFIPVPETVSLISDSYIYDSHEIKSVTVVSL